MVWQTWAAMGISFINMIAIAGILVRVSKIEKGVDK